MNLWFIILNVCVVYKELNEIKKSCVFEDRCWNYGIGVYKICIFKC